MKKMKTKELTEEEEFFLEEQDDIENTCPIHHIYCPDCFCEACIDDFIDDKRVEAKQKVREK